MPALKEHLFHAGMLAASAAGIIFLNQHQGLPELLKVVGTSVGGNFLADHGNKIIERVRDEWLHNREPKVNEVLEKALYSAYKSALNDMADKYPGSTNNAIRKRVTEACNFLAEVAPAALFGGVQDQLDKDDLFHLIGETPEDAAPRMRQVLAIAEDFGGLNARFSLPEDFAAFFAEYLPKRIAHYFKIELNGGGEATHAMQRIQSETIRHLTQGVTDKLDKQQELLNSIALTLQQQTGIDPQIKAGYDAAIRESLQEIHRKLDDLKRTTEHTEEMVAEILAQYKPHIYPERLLPLPFANDYFFGRKAQLLEAATKLQSRVPLALMSGIGGMGKSCLAREYILEYRDQYAYVAWVTISENRTFEEDIVGQLYNACGIDLAQYPGVALQFALVSSVLASPLWKGRRLLVIDNANELAQLERHLDSFKSCGWEVIVTTRCEPAGYHPITVEELPDDECRRLFLSHYRGAEDAAMTANEVADFTRLLTRIHRHTLLLEMLGKLGADQQYAIARMLAMLVEADIHHPELDIRVRVGNHAILNKAEQQARLENYIHSMFKPEDLPGADKDLLCCFAVLPPAEFTVEELNALFGLEAGEALRDFKEELTRIAAAGWLKRKAEGGQVAYRMHSMVQSVVEAKLKPMHKNTARLIAGFKKTFSLPLSENWQLLDDAYHAFEKLDAHPAVMSFGVDLGDRYSDIGNPERAIAIFQRAEIVYGREDGSAYEHALTYERLGGLHQSLGDTAKALEYFEKRKTLGEELYATNPRSESLKNGLAVSYERLGNLHQSLGDTAKALEHFEKRKTLGEELYAANPRSESLKTGLAISYERLGDLHQSLGDTAKALEYFEQENMLFEELYAANPRNVQLAYGLFVAYWRVARIHELGGDYKIALEYLRHALPPIEHLSGNTVIPEYKKWHGRILEEISRLEALQ